MSTDIKLSKAQMPQINQLGGFLDAFFGTFAGLLMKFPVPSTKSVLASLATIA